MLFNAGHDQQLSKCSLLQQLYIFRLLYKIEKAKILNRSCDWSYGFSKCLLEAVLLVDTVPDLPGLWSFVACEALRVQQQVDILGVW